MTEPAPSPGIRHRVDGAIARVTLDRPDQHNALHAADVTALRTFLDEVDADRDVRVLVLTGAGDQTFSSGASLPQMQTGEMSGEIFDTLTGRLARVRVPTVCALNGSVYGGGAELALCCDFRAGRRGMRLSVPAARLGVCYPIGGITRYVERLGLSSASRILLAAEEVEAEELLRIGYLTHLFAVEDFAAGVEALATRLASLAPLAVASMKELLLDVAAGRADPARARERVEACAASSDFEEGLRAWRERREPRFTGS